MARMPTFRSIAAAAWLMVLAAPVPAPAAGSPAGQAPDTVLLEELTWNELRDAIGGGKTTIILPAGGTEQNGLHMVLGKHNFIVKYAAEQIARRLGSALVAPVVAYVPEGDLDPPTGHMKWPGTITLPPAHFRALIEYAARSFKLHGFRDIVLNGDHGSYQGDLKTVADALTAEWSAAGVRVHFIAQYYAANGFIPWLESQGASTAEIGVHASLVDSSELMALDPKYVRTDRLGQGSPETGTFGDPRRASAELGRRGLELKIETAVSRIRQVVGARR